MITTMSNEEEETLTYEPTSFVAQTPNVNPDSPRHFKSKRRRNNANPKLKRRPQTITDFRSASNQKKDRVTDKGSKTLIERCRVALYRTISMDILLGSGSHSEDDKSVGSVEETESLNFHKPITCHLKVCEIRKVNSGKSDRHYGKPSLTRSKSDSGCPSNTKIPELRSSRQCHSVLLKVRNCEYTDENCLKNREMFLDRENSVSSLGRSITSSRNSSGFCDYTGTESEIDNLSSDGSSVIASEGSSQGNTSSSIDLSFDQDKQAEERLYPRSIERRCFGNGSHAPLSSVKSVPPSFTYSAITDEVFTLNNTTDSIVEDRILDDSIVKDEVLDDSIVSDSLDDSIINSKYLENSTVNDTRNICTRQPRPQGISPKRINKNNIKKKCKESRARSLGNITYGRPRNNSVDIAYYKNNELKQKTGDGISDSTNQLKPKNGYDASEPSCKLKQKMEKNDITSGSVGNRRMTISRKLSIEQCVEKLNLSNSRYGSNFSSLPRENSSNKHHTSSSSLRDILGKRRTTISLPLPKEKNMFNFVPNIRIESVV